MIPHGQGAGPPQGRLGEAKAQPERGLALGGQQGRSRKAGCAVGQGSGQGQAAATRGTGAAGRAQQLCPHRELLPRLAWHGGAPWRAEETSRKRRRAPAPCVSCAWAPRGSSALPPPVPAPAAARLKVPLCPAALRCGSPASPVYRPSRCAALGRSPRDMGTQISPVTAPHARLWLPGELGLVCRGGRGGLRVPGWWLLKLVGIQGAGWTGGGTPRCWRKAFCNQLEL